MAKIDEELKYAGYNLIVTSELDMDPLRVYETYHSLWKIENSFRITKSFHDAWPVCVYKKKTYRGVGRESAENLLWDVWIEYREKDVNKRNGGSQVLHAKNNVKIKMIWSCCRD